MSKRVVVTGIGITSSYGNDKEHFFNHLVSKKTFISKIPSEFSQYYDYSSGYYVKSPQVDLSEYDFPVVNNNMLNEQTKMALLSTKNALLDCGLILNKEKNRFQINNLPEKSLISIGTGFTNLETVFQSYQSHQVRQFYQFYESHTPKKEKYFNRMCVPLQMPNAISGWISILFNIPGPNFTVNTACASGTSAIGQAFEMIKYQDYAIAVTGGAECLKDACGATMRTFDVLDVLTKSEDGKPRPFSDTRSGFLFNEGAACILILEELEHAINRNAEIYGEITDFAANSDAYHIVQTDKSGKQMKKLLSDIDCKSIDYINLHGTGTILNDEVEKKIMLDIYGRKKNQPVLNSTKGIIGHSIGASGAIEAAVCLLSLKKNMLHGNLIDQPLPDLNLNIDPISKKLNRVLSLSMGFGGHNALLKFEKLE